MGGKKGLAIQRGLGSLAVAVATVAAGARVPLNRHQSATLHAPNGSEGWLWAP